MRGALVVARGPEGTRGWRVVEPSAMGEVKADGALTLPARQLVVCALRHRYDPQPIAFDGPDKKRRAVVEAARPRVEP